MIDETEDAHRALVGRIEDLSRAGIASCDPQGQLSRSTADVIVQVLVEAVYDVLMVDGRRQLSEDDRAYIREMTRRLTKDRLPKPTGPSKRFSISDRVVCCVGGERGWAAGTVQALDQDGVFPYVVKLDPPDTRLVSVPTDTSEQVRAEVCFGQRAGAMHFTRMCLPNALLRQKQRTPRFAAGERVACAVEDATSEYSDWSAGTVLAVNCMVKEWEGFPEGDSTVPYQVGLDAGDIVLVHRDEHWLIRELALQPAGRRVGADGSRCLGKFAKRRMDDGWQMVDHATRKVRKMQPEGVDGAECCDEEAGRCGGCCPPPLAPPRAPPPPQLECCEEKGCGGCRQPPEEQPPPPRPEEGEQLLPPPGEEGLPPNLVVGGTVLVASSALL